MNPEPVPPSVPLQHRRIKLGIGIFAAILLLGLAILRWSNADQQLVRILAIATGLLVALLLITYRAFAGIAETARNNPTPPVPDDEDEE